MFSHLETFKHWERKYFKKMAKSTADVAKKFRVKTFVIVLVEALSVIFSIFITYFQSSGLAELCDSIIICVKLISFVVLIYGAFRVLLSNFLRSSNYKLKIKHQTGKSLLPVGMDDFKRNIYFVHNRLHCWYDISNQHNSRCFGSRNCNYVRHCISYCIRYPT